MTTKNKQIRLLPTLIFTVGIIACLLLGFFIYKAVTTGEVVVNEPIASGAGSTNADVVKEASEETPVSAEAIQRYEVAADTPRMLTINALNISAKVRPMGINSIGAIAAPVNIYDSGWYTGSAKPGTIGALFIDGHASGATRKGLFAYIDTLKNGNEVSIERGDGQVFTYKVVYVETIPKGTVDMKKVLRTYGGAREGLNLMTCTGTWIKNERTYNNRVVVYTERVS